MTDEEFYVDAILAGGPLDLGADAEPDRIESVLGSAFIDARQPNSLRRDYGLIEFFFTRNGDGWLAQGVSVQVHRLVHGQGEELIPAPLRNRYGPFSSFLTFDDLRAGLAERIDAADFLVRHEFVGSSSYQVAGTPSEITVLNDPTAARDAFKPGHGDVWSIHFRSKTSIG